MEERSSTPTCERGNDLMAFLYGEVDEREGRDFERHLRTCGQCKVDVGSFRQISQSIGAWRQDSLGVAAAHAVASNPVLRSPELVKPSALVAIRSFFDLSPLWMKAAVTFAAVLFVVVAAVAVVRLFEGAEPARVSGEKIYTETELKKQIQEALARERDVEVRKNEVPPAQRINENNEIPKRRVVSRPSTFAQDGHKARQRPLTRAEREQLAADLRLISPDDETDFELLGDRINR